MTTRRHTLALVALIGFVASASACAGDDDDVGDSDGVASDKLMAFDSSDCLRGQRSEALITADAGTQDVPADSCVVSQRDGDTLSLQFPGVESICLEFLLDEIPWQPRIDTLSPGVVALSVEWPSDNTPACGSCIYDFSFELGPYDWRDVTEVRFELRPCPHCEIGESRKAVLATRDGDQSHASCD